METWNLEGIFLDGPLILLFKKICKILYYFYWNNEIYIFFWKRRHYIALFLFLKKNSLRKVEMSQKKWQDPFSRGLWKWMYWVFRVKSKFFGKMKPQIKWKSTSVKIIFFFRYIPMRKKQKSVKKYMKMKQPELANVIFEFLTLFLINI